MSTMCVWPHAKWAPTNLQSEHRKLQSEHHTCAAMLSEHLNMFACVCLLKISPEASSAGAHGLVKESRALGTVLCFAILLSLHGSIFDAFEGLFKPQLACLKQQSLRTFPPPMSLPDAAIQGSVQAAEVMHCEDT